MQTGNSFLKPKLLPVCFLLHFLSTSLIAQQSPDSVKIIPPVKSVWEIPHHTLWQIWMWPHRSAAFIITKERAVNYDTTYIKSYYKRLIITLPVSTRFLRFNLVDLKTGSRLNFAPNLEYDLGISISSRWASFIINSGVKVYSGEAGIMGKTKLQDYQLNLYGRKLTTDMFIQHYYGFYISNSRSHQSYTDDQPYSVRSDVQAFNMGVSTYYILNNRKFSYGNSFAFTEQQRKSAGSPLIGIYYSYFDASGKPSLVLDPFKGSFDSTSFIRRGQSHNFGINLGYIYTVVFLKKCYATASLVQGLGAKHVTYHMEDETINRQFLGGAGKLNVRLAMGYDQGRYFIGTMGMSDIFIFRGKANTSFEYTFGKFMVYLGYRFSILKAEKKILKRLSLIDY